MTIDKNIIQSVQALIKLLFHLAMSKTVKCNSKYHFIL